MNDRLMDYWLVNDRFVDYGLVDHWLMNHRCVMVFSMVVMMMVFSMMVMVMMLALIVRDFSWSLSWVEVDYVLFTFERVGAPLLLFLIIFFLDEITERWGLGEKLFLISKCWRWGFIAFVIDYSPIIVRCERMVPSRRGSYH